MEKSVSKKSSDLLTTKKSGKSEKEKSIKSKLNIFGSIKKNKNESVNKISLNKIDEKTKIEINKTSDDVKLYLQKRSEESQTYTGIYLH